MMFVATPPHGERLLKACASDVSIRILTSLSQNGFFAQNYTSDFGCYTLTSEFSLLDGHPTLIRKIRSCQNGIGDPLGNSAVAYSWIGTDAELVSTQVHND